jgi:two-component system, NarL family, sensor histidine kinase UhpB
MLMKIFCCLGIFFFYTCIACVWAQEKDIGDLRLRLSSVTGVREKIDVLNDYADTLCLHKSEAGQKLALEALQLSKQENYFIGIGDASHSLGLVKFRRDNDSAIFYFTEARKAYLQQYPGLAKFSFVLNNLSRTYDEQLRFDSALYWARQALQHTESSKEAAAVKNRWRMFSNGAMANAHAGNSSYDSSSIYYLKAISFAEHLHDSKMQGVYLKAMAGIQSSLGEYEKAVNYSKKALTHTSDDERAVTLLLANIGSYYNKLCDYDNAKLMADSSLAVGWRNNITNSVGRNYATLGNGKMAVKDFVSALKYYGTGLQYAKQLKNSKSSTGSLHAKLGEAYQALDSLAQAKENYLAALELGRGDNDFTSHVYFLLSKLMYKEGKYQEAYAYLQQYHIFHDSVYTAEKAKAVIELSTKYETAKKDQELLIFGKDKQLQQALLAKQLQQIEKDNALNREQQLALDKYELEMERNVQLLQIQKLDIENSRIKEQQQQASIATAQSKLMTEKKEKELSFVTIKNQRNWFIFLLLGSVVAVVILILLFNRYKLLKQLQNQQQLLDERQRISRELHDEVGATLSGIAMYSHLVKEQLKSNNKTGIENSLQVMQQSSSQMVEKLNDIVWLINPEKDSLRQLINKLEDYAIKMAVVKNIKVNIAVSDMIPDNVLPAETRRSIYLLCKEAINNAVKYSNATMLDFIVTENAKLLQITIADNGVGFDAFQQNTGNGLANMKARAAAVNGLLQVDSAKDTGTTIKLSIKITP